MVKLLLPCYQIHNVMNRHENKNVITYDVLLVDSKKSSRDLTGRMLDRAGYSVVTAEHGKEAIDILHDGSRYFRLVITELLMPYVDGFELMKAIKHEWNMPVMILSSKGDEITVNEVFRFGADDFMKKPFIDPELIQRVRQLLMLALPGNGGLKNAGQLRVVPPAHPAAKRSSYAA